MARHDGYMVDTPLHSVNNSYFALDADDVATNLVPIGKSPEDSKRHAMDDPRFSVEEYLAGVEGKKLSDMVPRDQGLIHVGDIFIVNEEGLLELVNPKDIYIPCALESDPTKEIDFDEQDGRYGFLKTDGTFIPFRSPFGDAKPENVMEGKTFQNEDEEYLEGTLKTDSNVSMTLNSGVYKTPKLTTGEYFYKDGVKVEGTSSAHNSYESVVWGSSGSAPAAKVITLTLDGTEYKNCIEIAPSVGYWNRIWKSYNSSTGGSIVIKGSDLGNATAAQVLKDKTFSSTAGRAVSGTMPDRTVIGSGPGMQSKFPNTPANPSSNPILQIQTNTDNVKRISISPNEGYYKADGVSYVSAPASLLGNTTVDKVLKGETFTSESGVKLTGTMNKAWDMKGPDGQKGWHVADWTYVDNTKTLMKWINNTKVGSNSYTGLEIAPPKASWNYDFKTNGGTEGNSVFIHGSYFGNALPQHVWAGKRFTAATGAYMAGTWGPYIEFILYKTVHSSASYAKYSYTLPKNYCQVFVYVNEGDQDYDGDNGILVTTNGNISPSNSTLKSTAPEGFATCTPLVIDHMTNEGSGWDTKTVYSYEKNGYKSQWVYGRDGGGYQFARCFYLNSPRKGQTIYFYDHSERSANIIVLGIPEPT